jgi:hypothetical protein
MQFRMVEIIVIWKGKKDNEHIAVSGLAGRLLEAR